MNTENNLSPIHYLGVEHGNRLYIKREDLIPFSFGGNKARKAYAFFKEIDRGDFDCIVTYGSSSSNHCRVVSNLACQKNMPCFIISPEEASDATYNSMLMELFGAKIQIVPVENVHDTIENIIETLKSQGKKPYFIPGGGHGNIGTQAFVDCYDEIKKYEKDNGVFFDYIFLASGTGTTQAGLVCGQLINKDIRRIIGISIARKNPRGRNVVIDSIREYLGDVQGIDEATVFIDSYIGTGYGQNNAAEVINYVMKKYGIPLDGTYTGKAFYGMLDYIGRENITEKNILFIHTGGTPLFFDYLKEANK